MPRLLLLLPVLIICLTACGPGYEARTETDDLGFRKEFSVDEAGVRQGVLREYDAAGHLLVEEHYTDGELNGPRLVYDASGQLLAEENMEMGRYAGTYRGYAADGTLSITGEYTDGAMNGLWYAYYPNGTLQKEMTFRNNDQHGPVRQWYPDGTPELSGHWKDGEDFHGPLIRYDSTGQLERVLDCALNRGCRTVWTPDSSFAMPVAEVDMEKPGGEF